MAKGSSRSGPLRKSTGEGASCVRARPYSSHLISVKGNELFSTPSAPGAGITWADHLGALLVIDVLGQEHGIETVHGTSNPVRANIYVVAGPGSGAVYEDALIFPLGLIAQTKRKIGEKILARLTQGAKQLGKNAPWLLEASSDPGEIRLAEEHMRKLSGPAFASPGDAEPPF